MTMKPWELPKQTPCLLILAALLLSGSLALLSSPVAPLGHWMGDPLMRVVRQGAYGLLSLALAWCVGRFGHHRPLLRHWYVFPSLLLLVIVAAPISLSIGGGQLVIGYGLHYGYGWWARTTGQIAFLLALVFAMSAALPLYVRCGRPGRRALGSCLILSAALPSAVKDVGLLFVVFALLGLTCSVVLPPKRLALALLGFVSVFFLAFCGWCLACPQTFGRQFRLILHGAPNFQRDQALVSVHAGGLFGNAASPTWIPEWHTDFLFARLCGAGGLAAGAAALLVTGMLLFLAWRITGRQTELRARVLAAGCAAALTVPALLHIAVNLGLFPTTGFHFPFFSYSPRLLLLDGMLVGLLISMQREDPVGKAAESNEGATPTPTPTRWPMTYIQAGVALLLALFALRMGVLVFAPSWTRNGNTVGAEQQEAPVRGRILDMRGRVLAQTGERLIACADPHLLAKSDNRRRIPEIAHLLGLDEQVVLDRVKDTRLRYVRLKKDLTPEAADAVRHLKLKTFFIDTMPARDYPFNTPLAHVLGCTGSADDYHGLSGLEVARDKMLKAGGELRVTLDIDLQATLQDLAEAAVKETGAKRVQLVVMDARTGAIHAAAQVPALHGRALRDDSKPLLWLASGEVFEPGGLLKPLVVAAALENGVITPESRINCEQGVWTYEGLPMHDPGRYQELTPAEILQKSSNIGMAKIGLLLGEGPLYQAVAGWGMNRSCAAGLDFGERGILNSTNRWSKLEVTRIPIGHGCAVTLLQLLRTYSALFNDGRIVEPTLIAATRPAPGTAWQSVPVAEPTPVIRPETAVWLRITLRTDLGEGLSVIGQRAIVQKTFQGKSGYDPDRVLTAFIGSHDIAGTPHLIAVWLDEPVRRDGESNPALDVFRTVMKKAPGNGN
jgi:cell division protein FtsI (penicillin-binding protein 3)